MTEPAWTPEETERLAAFGAVMFNILFEQFCDGTWEVEINDLITINAARAGLVDAVDFDPEEHDDPNGACVAGDPFYTITSLGRKACVRARGEVQS